MHKSNFQHVQGCQRRLRSAFTFFELLLVLAIIVALAGMSWPQLSGILRRESLMSNVEQVRQVLDEARVKAVNEGVRYQFRYEPYGRKFVLLPYDLLSDPNQPKTEGNSPVNSLNATATDSKLAIVHELTEDCQFYVPPVLLTGETATMEQLPEQYLTLIRNGLLHRDVSWSPPIVYSPDGSSTDASVTVSDREQRYSTLSVRGLTGAVVTSRIDKLPELYGGRD